MKQFSLSALLAFTLLLTGCMGGTLSDTKDFEMFPLRGASAEEGKELKRCLKVAHQLQENRFKKTGKYARRLRDLPINNYCGDFLMAQQGTKTGYEIRAELREEDQTVRWSVNEKGVIEEHLEGNENDQFMDL